MIYREENFASLPLHRFAGITLYKLIWQDFYVDSLWEWFKYTVMFWRKDG